MGSVIIRDGSSQTTTLAQPVNFRWASQEGSPYPLGLTWISEEQAFNFSLYSKHATRVTLLLYNESDQVTPIFNLTLDPFHHKSGRVWHCRIPESSINEARYYAYSIDGPAPNGRYEWNTFDPQKILLDPYARTVFFPLGFDRHACSQPGSTAGKAPLGLICKDRNERGQSVYDWAGDQSPSHQPDAVIYELHCGVSP